MLIIKVILGVDKDWQSDNCKIKPHNIFLKNNKAVYSNDTSRQKEDTGEKTEFFIFTLENKKYVTDY